MNRRTSAMTALFSAALLAVSSGCTTGGQTPAPENEPDALPAEDQPIDLTDVVDFGDLLTQELEASSAAAQVGDPAQLLGAAQAEAERSRAHVASVLDRLNAITDHDADETGTTPRGLPYGIWESTRPDGTNFRLTLVRISDIRVRYFMQGAAAGSTDYLSLLTGVFIKRGERRGAGRFHLSLTRLNQLDRGPGLSGQIHFYFANHRDDRRGRRIVYRNVRSIADGADAEVLNYASDLVRRIGEGGRFRSVIIEDIVPEIDGREAYGMRVRWRAGQGGRGDAVLVAGRNGNPVVVGHAHECWDADGLRTAYADTFAQNDARNPNEGTIEDCGGLTRDDVPETAGDDDAADRDPLLDEMLEETGCDDISDDDAEREPEDR